MTKKVMVADDEEEVRNLLIATLEDDERYRLLLARDGEEALAVARREKPDLVFLDVRMPLLDGCDVCRELKRDPATGHIVVVMLTALSQDHDKVRAAAAGADDYFVKPFSPTELLKKVEKVLCETGGTGREGRQYQQ